MTIKDGLAKSDKDSWHDQPKEETNRETQAGASRVKIAGLMRKRVKSGSGP